VKTPHRYRYKLGSVPGGHVVVSRALAVGDHFCLAPPLSGHGDAKAIWRPRASRSSNGRCMVTVDKIDLVHEPLVFLARM
jgi:hypothetical protein